MHMYISAHKENFWTCRKRPSVLDIKGGHLRTVAQKGHTCKLKMLLQTKRLWDLCKLKFNLQIKNVAAN